VNGSRGAGDKVYDKGGRSRDELWLFRGYSYSYSVLHELMNLDAKLAMKVGKSDRDQG